MVVPNFVIFPLVAQGGRLAGAPGVGLAVAQHLEARGPDFAAHPGITRGLGFRMV